jgi:dTDP-4-amino-4,6-dideoxygalactose transaminase
MGRIRFIDLAAQFAEERGELLPRIEKVLESGMLIGGPEVEALETELAAYCGVHHAIAVNSGTDALILGMAAAGIGPGDEVITPPNSFISSASSITRIGATPVFADVGNDELLNPAAVEAAITPKTVAIMAVHLRGNVCDMAALNRIAARAGLLLIEDAAQAVGSAHAGGKTGSLGRMGCFSAHPLKLLNAAGDAGFITTDSPEIAEKARRLRNNGLKDRDTVVDWGTVSRLDAVQAAILRFRLSRLDTVIARRRANAERYLLRLADAAIGLPRAKTGVFHSYNTFVIRCEKRDPLQRALAEQGIEAPVHYPTPLHLQPVTRELGYKPGSFPVAEALAQSILSLPVHQFLKLDDIDRVADTILGFLAPPALAARSPEGNGNE